jgi:hypothetical protein
MLLFSTIDILGAVITSIVVTLFFYLILAKYTCTVHFKKNEIFVKYMFPLLTEKITIIRKNTVIKYELGYYYYLSSEHSLSPIQILYPHDRLYFYEKVNDKLNLYDSLNINVRYSDFKKIRFLLKENSNVLLDEDI